MARKRFRLLIYERMWRRWAAPCMLIIPASLALWWSMPRVTDNEWYRSIAILPAVIALVILVFTYLARRRAWVECRSDHLRVQTPLYPLAISYGRLKEVLPTSFSDVFNPAKEKGARRRWLNPYWGHTVLVARLSRYPVSEKWLRLWLSPYLLYPQGPGLVFLVEDWMGLSRQIEDARAAWAVRRARKQQGQAQTGRFR